MVRPQQLRKETSERSDEENWIKAAILASGWALESIEGCNQNTNNVTTHLFERACMLPEGGGDLDVEAAFQAIVDLEGSDRLERVLNCASALGLPLHYVLYSYDPERVYVLKLSQTGDVAFEKEYSSFTAFGEWLATIKGWRSNKVYSEPGLPRFDVALREALTPWPTNIDAFAVDAIGQPRAIIEFQNANSTGVTQHCNNVFFWGYRRFNDQRRWLSQDILRVQSGLPLFIVVWDTKRNHLRLKLVSQIIHPAPLNWRERQILTADLSALGEAKASLNSARRIGHDAKFELSETNRTGGLASRYRSMRLEYVDKSMVSIFNYPPTRRSDHTFPMIYYSFNSIHIDEESLISEFNSSI